VDFDGVLHSYAQGFTGACDLPGEPIRGAREWIAAVQSAGYDVIVYSCRARSLEQAREDDPGSTWDPGGREAMREWLHRHGFPPLPITGTKPAATVYLDDRALAFRGTFPSLEKLARFKPWQTSDAMARAWGDTTDKPQEILSPQAITDFVRAVFGGVIRFDPCATRDPRDTVKASVRLYGPPEADGLKANWIKYAYVNPPFRELRKWLAKACVEAERGVKIALLAPVRSRSEWWREARSCALRCGGVVELNRVAFVGYGDAFPDSLVLLFFNVSRDRIQDVLTEHKLGAIL
jgi:hypothetical protein